MVGNKYVKRIIFPLLLVSVLMLLLVPGCGDKEADEATKPSAETSELTQQQMQQIFADMIVAVQNTKTYKSDINMKMAMEATGGTQAGKMNMVMTATGAYDQEKKNMQMTMDMKMDMDTPEMGEEMQNISVEMYILEDDMYMKMDMPMIGEQWVKMSVDEEMMQTFNSDMVSEQLGMLESAGKIELLRNETVDGYDCYVFKLTPDMEKIIEWIGKQQVSEGGLGLENIDNIAEVFKELSYVAWIDKDSGLITKMDASMRLEFNAEEFGAEPEDFDNMKINITMNMRMYDYNKPLTIVLPEEAKEAIDISEIGGIGQ